MGYAAWLFLPLAAFLLTGIFPEDIGAWIIFPAIILYIVVALWIFTIVTRAAHKLLQGKPLQEEYLQKNLARTMKNLVLVGFLEAIIIFGGLILLIVPGIIFATWFAFSQIITMLDGETPINALKKSKKIVTGKFKKVLWRIVAGPVLVGFIYIIAYSIIAITIALILGQDIVMMLEAEEPAAWLLVLDGIGDILLFPFMTLYFVALYQDTKMA